MLQQMFVYGVRNLQPIDERECRGIFTAVGNLGELVLKVVDVRLEALTCLILTERRRWLFFLASW